ncbi:helix-turn-helix domain-containing protein [Glutamicibacter sp. PS]|uniref:AraC-like ligand-binding domain-containing protein n=1 Tax=Glutamicibacter sp. PS TaxID=3075634 RepID=UPI00284A86C6|nr:helix-turn-helix domain-containing protein [Glutamicibacter sp. PS]MDR4531951.1 helix-turn-helix domain-containing protein [Glutamicibacter sp. PS]
MYQTQQVDSFAAWSRLISQAFVPLESEQVASGHFSASLAVNMLDDIGLMRIASKPHAVLRTDALAAAGDGAYFKVSLQVTGHGMLIQDGREVTLAPGELAIYDTQRPYSLVFDAPAKVMVVMIPQDSFRLTRAEVAQITATKLDAAHPLTGTVAPLLSHLGEHLPHWDNYGGAALAHNAVDLLGTAMSAILGSSVQGNARERQRRGILQYIERHLADPRLNAHFVAEANFISVRTLHALFADQPRTVAAHIAALRMQRAAELLTDPLLATVSVQSIGARVGFTDASGFSRAFTRAHRISPTAYRREHLTVS